MTKSQIRLIFAIVAAALCVIALAAGFFWLVQYFRIHFWSTQPADIRLVYRIYYKHADEKNRIVFK